MDHHRWIAPAKILPLQAPLRGLLGLICPSSRLFFVLLCVISSMQRLVGPLDAFCQLLRLPMDQHGHYVWDPCHFGFQITRWRNYFRNFDDVDEIGVPLDTLPTPCSGVELCFLEWSYQFWQGLVSIPSVVRKPNMQRDRPLLPCFIVTSIVSLPHSDGRGSSIPHRS